MTQTPANPNKSSDKKGLDRLFDDLMTESTLSCHPAPTSLLEKVLQRIASEPARVWTDPDGLITAVNPAFSQLCGYSFHEIQGRKPGSFLHGPLTEQNVVKKIRSSLATRSPIDAVLTNYHKDGSPYKVKISIRPVYLKGKLQGFSAEEIKLS